MTGQRVVISELGVTNGRVSILIDRDHNGTADDRVTFAQGLRNPHGLAFREGYLYIAAENQVVRFRWQGGQPAQGAPEVIIPNLPTGGHATRHSRGAARPRPDRLYPLCRLPREHRGGGHRRRPGAGSDRGACDR